MFKALSVIFFFLYAGIGHTELPTQKFSPPYPDVWGYDISDFPAMRGGLADVDAYRMSDGDIWFVIDHSYKYKDPMNRRAGYKDEKYILLKFFKGEQVELNATQINELYKSTLGRNNEISKINTKVYFSDGSTLEEHHEPSPKLCFHPEFIKGYFVKTDYEKKQTKYSILAVSPHVKVWRDEGLCEVQAAPFYYERLILLDNIIDLGDNTFIAYADGGNLILRFDQNLNTKFKSINPVTAKDGNIINRDFFVVDYSVIQQLEMKYAAAKLPFNQTMHDELLLYLADKYK